MTDNTLTTNQPSAPDSFNEAPAVVFTQLYGLKENQIVQFNLTVRAETPEAAMDGIIRGIQYAHEHYKLSTVRPETGIPGPGPVNAPASPANAPTPAGAPAAPANGNGNGNGAGMNGYIHAVKLEVVPSADGKVALKWYGAGHQYPDITSTRPADKVLELLRATGDWTEDHIKMVGTYQVRHKIAWRESEKMNSKGKPYRDIVSIIPE